MTDKNKDYSEIPDGFYFVAGYTSGGFPYGITWEEAIEEGLVDENLEPIDSSEPETDDLPF